MSSDLITADMTVLDIVARFRETEAVFRRYDAAAGECLCCNALFETLKQVSERYAIDLNELVHDLNAAIVLRSNDVTLGSRKK